MSKSALMLLGLRPSMRAAALAVIVSRPSKLEEKPAPIIAEEPRP